MPDKHCPSCGESLETDDKFCFKCGADVSKRTYSKETDASERLGSVEKKLKQVTDFLEDKFAEDEGKEKKKSGGRKTLFGD